VREQAVFEPIEPRQLELDIEQEDEDDENDDENEDEDEDEELNGDVHNATSAVDSYWQRLVSLHPTVDGIELREIVLQAAMFFQQGEDPSNDIEAGDSGSGARATSTVPVQQMYFQEPEGGPQELEIESSTSGNSSNGDSETDIVTIDEAELSEMIDEAEFFRDSDT
jgi:hypothetical protein